MMKMLESKAVEIVEDSESEPELAELVLLQEEISSQPTQIVKLPIGTLIDLPAEPTMELISSLEAMRVSFFLKSSDVYEPLQIFLQEAGSNEIGALVCGLVFSGAEFSCYAAHLLLELPVTATNPSRESIPPPPPWLRCDALVPLSRPPPWPD